MVAFANSSGIGASASASAATGAPSVTLTTTQASSLVYATGNDWDGAVARTVPASQTMVNQVLVNGALNTFWTQRQTATTGASGSSVTINDTAPTNDRWNMTAVEIKGVTAALAPTSTVVVRSSGSGPSVFGEAVGFTATVSSGSGTPTGSVQFKDGAASVGAPVALVSGQATLSTGALSVGSHSITAVYGGDASFAASTSGPVTQSVTKAATATAVTGDAPDPSSAGQAYVVSWSVSVTAPGAGSPSGNVTVSDGTDSCTASVAAGQCSLTSSTAGAKTLTATYAGDGNFTGSAGTAPHTVNSVAPTSTVVVLSAGSGPSVFGEVVGFTATVSSGAGTPSGSVQFKDGAASVGAPVALVSGQATLSTGALSVGSHSITAVYGGDASFAGSTSGPVTQSVTKAATATAVTGDAPDPSSAGQAYVVSWSVSVTAPGAGSPSGNVTVSDGTDSCTGVGGGGAVFVDVVDGGCQDVDRDLCG